MARLRPSYGARAASELRPRTLRTLGEQVAHRAGLFPGDFAIDVLCGDGLLANTLGRRLTRCRAVGVDPDRGLLREARAHAAEEGAGRRVDHVQAHPAHLPFRDECVQLVTSGLALHSLSEEALEGALEEVARVLYWFGKLLVFDVSPPPGGGADAFGDDAQDLLKGLGFRKVSVQTLDRLPRGRALLALQGKKQEAPEGDDGEPGAGGEADDP